MPRFAAFARRLDLAFGLLGVVSLGIITLASPGATRMHAWPWSLAYAAALLAPVGMLATRVWLGERPMALPRRDWFFTALTAGVAILLSGLNSPFRGPCLLWSAPLLAGLAVFFVGFNWLHAAPDQTPARRIRLLTAAAGFLGVVAATSAVLWIAKLGSLQPGEVFEARNPFPLGHSNYTAGLALLMLPLFAAQAWRHAGWRRSLWGFATLVALGLLFTSGSRGGLIGLAVLLAGGVIAAPWPASRKLLVAGAAVVAALLFAVANPRIRAGLSGSDAAGTPNASNVQRAAMLRAGWAAGWSRPALGWGPGSTPLAYPIFRGVAHGGVEDVLQLHSLPLQTWAELGGVGVALLLLGLALAARAAPQHRFVAVTLAGYLAFSLTDYQVDVPIFIFVLAGLAAALAPPAQAEHAANPRWLDLLLRFAALALLGYARPDPTPRLNLEALDLARNPATVDQAAERFKASLALNPNQEIAAFNLGWLEVVRHPRDAAYHFVEAARLVPDKGGVYFGTGLAQLNQGQRQLAAHSFAVECLNDPVFLVSPWWRDPVVGAERTATLAEARTMLAAIQQPDAAYLAALIPWLEGTAPASDELVARANTPERIAYFRTHPVPPAFATAPLVVYRRERSGYPVLMRDLDLAVPVDLFDVQENSLAVGPYRFLFPAKGWLNP